MRWTEHSYDFFGFMTVLLYWTAYILGKVYAASFAFVHKFPSASHVMCFLALNLGNVPGSLQHPVHAGERTDDVGNGYKLHTSTRKTMC